MLAVLARNSKLSLSKKKLIAFGNFRIYFAGKVSFTHDYCDGDAKKYRIQLFIYLFNFI